MKNKLIASKKFVSAKRLILVSGDITKEPVDAIVNAANSRLQHGGGVAWAILREGGPIIQQESDKIGYVPVGKVALTTAGKLPASYIIHAVGPKWGEGHEDQKLKDAVLNSLQLAAQEKYKSISMPAISSGIFGFPKDRCAKIMLSTVNEFLENNSDSSIIEVRICLFDTATIKAFQSAFKK